MFWMNWSHGSTFMPPAATALATEVDNLYSFLLITSLIACVILIGGMIYFALKYKRQTPNDKTPYISHDTRLEILWSVIPLIIFLVVFAWGWMIYHDMRNMPKDGLEVHVTGKQWAWTAEYKNGVKSSEIVVPVNRDIKIVMTSTDVIHSLYIPSFRIKQDAVPGRYTSLWFRAEKLGEFHVFCTEFCGTSHSGMITKLKVLSESDFDKWLTEEADSGLLPIAERGKKIFNMKCASCHYADQDKAKIGPSLYGLHDSENHPVEDGAIAKVDENYIRESILMPQAKLAKGYPLSGPRMISFQGQISENELAAVIEFIKTLKK